MNFITSLAFASWFSVLVPLGSSFLGKQQREWKWLRILLILSFLSDSAGFCLSKLGYANLWLINIFFLVQFLILVKIFQLISEGLDGKKHAFFFYLGASILIAHAIDFFITGSTSALNSYSSSFSCLAITILCLRFFIHILDRMPTPEIHKYSMAWLVIAVFLYHSGTFLLFLLNNYILLSDRSIHQSAWALHNLLNIIKNILFALAIWRNLSGNN